VLPSYLPIFLFLLIVLGLAATMYIISGLFGPKIKFKAKMESYECGLPPIGSAFQRSSIRYYLTAVLFILFDVETVFLYPWAVNFKLLAWTGFVQVLVFTGILLLGYLYVLRKGLLEWR
jgi:NADH-quinone oxidoreductase subunit A